MRSLRPNSTASQTAELGDVTLAREMDGTLGDKIANDYRTARMLRGLYTNPKLVWRIARCLVPHPLVTSTMIEHLCLRSFPVSFVVFTSSKAIPITLGA